MFPAEEGVLDNDRRILIAGRSNLHERRILREIGRKKTTQIITCIVGIKKLPEGWLQSTSGSMPRLMQPLEHNFGSRLQISYATEVTILLPPISVN